MDLTEVVEIRAGVRSGKPCFVGTRIAVDDLLEYVASGMTTDDIVRDLPELPRGTVRAAIEFVALGERRLADDESSDGGECADVGPRSSPDP